MRIALDAYHAARLHGGIARYTRGLASAMFELEKEHQYVLFSNHFGKKNDEWNPHLEQVAVVSLNAPKRLMQGLWNTVSWPPVEHWTGKIDLFHGMHFVLPAVSAARTILTVHDLTFLRHPELFSDSKLNERGYLKELPAALKRANEVIAVSESTKHDLMELMHYPEENIHVIYEGVEPHFFVGNDEQKVRQILTNYKLEKPYMIFLVGAPEPRKNLQRTIRAAYQADPDVPVAIVGPEDELRKLLGSMSEHVHFLGFVPDKDLPSLLRGAEISLYPSLYEGFGLPILESMAAGVPVITSHISSCPEVAGDVGVLVDPYHEEEISTAIAALLGDDLRKSKLREAGIKRALDFSWQRAAGDVLKLYGEMV